MATAECSRIGWCALCGTPHLYGLFSIFANMTCRAESYCVVCCIYKPPDDGAESDPSLFPILPPPLPPNPFSILFYLSLCGPLIPHIRAAVEHKSRKEKHDSVHENVMYTHHRQIRNRANKVAWPLSAIVTCAIVCVCVCSST